MTFTNVLLSFVGVFVSMMGFGFITLCFWHPHLTHEDDGSFRIIITTMYLMIIIAGGFLLGYQS